MAITGLIGWKNILYRKPRNGCLHYIIIHRSQKQSIHKNNPQSKTINPQNLTAQKENH